MRPSLRLPPAKNVADFLEAHCNKCQNEKKHKGDLRLDDLVVDFASPAIMGHWEESMNRINSGDMPPEKEPRPKPEDINAVADWIAGQLREAEAARQTTGADTVAFLKLTRDEYANTIRDLLGVTFDPKGAAGLPEDPDWKGFERIGSVLTLSPAHVEKYLAAAEMVLDEALSLRPEPKRENLVWTAWDMRWKDHKREYEARGIADQVRIEIVPNNYTTDTWNLAAEVKRMLADPKAKAFAESFPRQWLQLRRVGMFPPDKVLYPDYDDNLEHSMVAETVGFFTEVLHRNGSLREFLDSDWTMLNERLAMHYGIDGVRGDQMQRVSLKPDNHRGGLLTQGSVLSLTSDGTRHRPVHRGVWLLDAIIGKPAPPPPANVPAPSTPDAKSKKTTVREKLEAHRADPNCNACYTKIDPPGIAFDNYDAIGRWRTVGTVKDGVGEDPKLDASGTLSDGRKFSGPEELKKILLSDLDKFAAAVTDKLATYALRRGMIFSDREELKRIVEQAKSEDYKLRSLIESLVTSPLFVKR